jgi:hypothetical protein
VTPNSENIKAQADEEAKVTKRFIRIIQRKDLPWERDSIARAANDPEHIPDCNVKATVGQHFLFHEPIPRAINGQRYLREPRSHCGGSMNSFLKYGQRKDSRRAAKTVTN